MPRNGDGSSDNAVEAGHNIVHGAGAVKDSHVDRADKIATPPPPQKGAGLEDLPASGGVSQGLAQGPDRGQGGKGSSN